MAALNAARQAGGQAGETDAPDAVGQTARLLAAGGAANDVFGYSVCRQRRHGNRRRTSR